MIAKKMGEERRDYVETSEASEIVEREFVGFASPIGRSWLQVLRFRGVLRGDPHPKANPEDVFQAHSEVFRFSFQRFQDHLMVEALLEANDGPESLFSEDGAFQFIFSETGDDIHWRWRGVFNALFIQYADRFGGELVDALPGGFDDWWDEWGVEDAFVESVRWRSTQSFTPRSLELLNQIRRHYSDLWRILIEVSVVEDHPWNANLLHDNLLGHKIAQRDAIWTLSINEAYEDPGHPVSRLTDWILGTGPGRATVETLSLAAITMAWVCSSTNSTIRDRATKALSSLFLRQPNIIAQLASMFDGCDDIYVHERIWGAAYGACLRSYDEDLLAVASSSAFSFVFERKNVPEHLLLRDYARGVVELAYNAGYLCDDVDLVRCRPPYDGKKVHLNVKKAALEARAEKVGAESILYSCYKGLADFGRYVVEGRVGRFSRAPLSGLKPLTNEELCGAFESEVITGDPKLEYLFECVASAYRSKRTEYEIDDDTFPRPHTPTEDLEAIEAAELMLCAQLSPEMRKRYRSDAAPSLEFPNSSDWRLPSGKEPKTIDENSCKLWIANRAISYGWTKSLFPHDTSYGDDRVRGSKTERIGKKYQRLALYELLARLADQYWLAPDWGLKAKVYDNPLDVEFTRDVEPSIFPTDENTDNVIVPPLRVEEKEPDQIDAWVNEQAVPKDIMQLALCEDMNEDGWLALYRYASHDIDFPEKGEVYETPWKQTQFHFIFHTLVDEDERAEFVKEAARRKIDFHEWLPADVVNGPYIGELGRRDLWPDLGRSKLTSREAPEVSLNCQPTVTSFLWESHLDGSLADGWRLHPPSPAVIEQLSLITAPGTIGQYLDSDGKLAVAAANRERGNSLLINQGHLAALERKLGMASIWFMIGERMGWPKKTRTSNPIVSRFNGMLWHENGKEKVKTWTTNSR